MAATEHVRFKLKYRKYLDVALSISLGLHLIAFALVPTIEIHPYRSKVEELEVIDIPPEIEIPPPPKDIQRPKIPVETLDEEVEEDVTIEDTTLDPLNLPAAPPPPPPSAGGGFYVFDKAPKPLRIVEPEYPVMARTAEIDGKVTLKVTVDENGRVIRAEVVFSTASVFDKSALTAIYQWTFVPAEQSGNPVKATIIVPVIFTLDR